MDCESYRRLYPKYSKLPLAREITDAAEGQAHGEHFHECLSCGDWTLTRRVEARGARVEDFPCVHIADAITQKFDSPEDNPFEDPDVILWRLEHGNTIGIPIRDGGSSIVAIKFCPWCGVSLNGDS